MVSPSGEIFESVTPLSLFSVGAFFEVLASGLAGGVFFRPDCAATLIEVTNAKMANNRTSFFIVCTQDCLRMGDAVVLVNNGCFYCLKG